MGCGRFLFDYPIGFEEKTLGLLEFYSPGFVQALTGFFKALNNYKII
jgi:hypothetical protein